MSSHLQENREASSTSSKCLGNSMSGTGIRRLPSLRGQRDLTLGLSHKNIISPSIGVKPKRTFTPNIPARRDKKDLKVENKKSSRDKQRNRKEEKKERSKTRNKPELIQMGGAVFGEGVEASKKMRSSWGGGGGGSRDEPSVMQRPKLNLQNCKVDHEKEEEKLKSLLRDDFVDDLDDPSSSDSIPVQLPMRCTGNLLMDTLTTEVKPDNKFAVNSRLRIKKEPKDPEEFSLPNHVDHVHLQDVKPKIKKEQEKYSDRKSVISEGHLGTVFDSSKFLFFHLPHCLPATLPDTQKKTKLEPGTAPPQKPDKSTSESQQCTLSDLPDGRLGTIRVHKSGRTTLQLGSQVINLELGTQVAFLQDLVSVQPTEVGDGGDMVMLGHIPHRVIGTPDIENMLDDLDLR